MKPTPRLRHFLAALGGSILAISSAAADTIYWDGATASWNTATNWTTDAGATTPDPGAAPGASDDTIFNRTGQNGNISVRLDADQAALSLTFNSTGTTTITGNTSGTTARQLTLGTGGITVNSGAGAVGIGTTNNGIINLVLSGTQAWTNNSANALNVGTAYNNSATSANVDLGANQLTIDGSARINIGVVNQAEAVLTGSGALIKNGSGVFSLGGKNTGYSGNVTVTEGILYYGDSPDALGTGNLLITGGAIEGRWSNAFTRTQGTGPGEIQITGGVSGFGGGNNSPYNIGAITWGSSTFNPTEFILQTSNASATGKSTLSSSIELNGANRTIRTDQVATDLANGWGTFSGNITNSGATAGLIKTGTGHHILSGTNTYDGGTTINQGILTFQKIAAMPSTGNVQVNDGTALGIRVGGAGNWTDGTSGVGTLGGLLAGNGGAGTSTVGYSGNVGVLLDMAANTTYGGDIGNVGTSLALYKMGTSSLTLTGNNSYSGGTVINQGALIADSATALGSGAITFKGGTLQYTANTAASDFGSQIANSTSAILLNTNSQNVTLSGIAAGNTGGLTKSGAGALTLTGTNTYTGTTAISAGTFVVDGGTTSIGDLTLASNTSLSVINGGTLNTVGVIGDEGVSNLTWSVIGGGATSTWNLGGSNFYLFGYNPPKSNNDMTIDGAGVAASAVVTNIQDLQWGRSTFNSDLLVTNGGSMSVNRDVQIGSTYYGETGINNTITIQGGTANSIMTVGRDFYVGYGDRAAASSNTTTVNAGGQLTITQHMYVGHVNATANSDNPATANQLTVNGGGTATMNQLSLGFADADGRDTPANVVEVTSGGQLSTTGISYIGRADNPTSTSNDNTMTVSGTLSSWNAGNQTVYVGHTNNTSAQSNNNILTVGTSGALTNVAALTVGFGSGTETGNHLVVNGSITATAVTVSDGNSLSGTGTVNGPVTFNSGATAAFTQGSPMTITGVMTYNDTQVHLNLPADLPDGTYTLATSSAVPVLAGAFPTPIVDSGSYGAGGSGAISLVGNDLVLTVTGAGGGTAYQTWATGSEPFDGDANGDGVKDGLAFLLGAANPSENAIGRLPTVTESGGDLVLNFNCLPVAARGTATLKVAHSNNLASWTATTDVVPDANDPTPDNDVTFVVGAGPAGPPALNSVTATIDAAAAAPGKLFGRLEATQP